MKSSSNFLFKAVLSVTFFTVIDRMLGFVFKIYLSRELGAENMGVYQVALSIFFLLLTATTSGIPLVVSKLTAKYESSGNRIAAFGTVSAALVAGLVSAALVCSLTLAFSRPIGKLMASPESMAILFLMLPGVIFSGVYAAFRGNLWGNRKYTTMSVIEVIEQLSRIMLTVMLFLLGFDKLKMTAVSLSASCLVTAVCCICCYFASRGRMASPKGYIAPLLSSSVPITFVRASSSLVNSVIAVIVPMILINCGHTNEQAMYIFGSSIGMAMPLLYIPITVVGSLAYVMLPALSSTYASGNMVSTRRKIESALKFSVVVAAFFVPAFRALGTSIGKFVYDNADAGKFLSQAAWLLIPISVENIASSMLNSLDLEKRGFINYMIGSAVLFGIIGIFSRNFSISVLPVALGAGLTVSSALDVIAIRKCTGIKLDFLYRLLTAAALILPATYLTRTVFTLCAEMPLILSLAISSITGCAFMFLLSLVFGIFDFGFVSGGKKSADAKKFKIKKRNKKLHSVAKNAQ